jgi:excisionase family DNA binding protein
MPKELTINEIPQTLTFEQIPQAVGMLIDEVKALRSTLMEKQSPLIVEDRWFNLDELRKYLPDHPAKNTVYCWVSSNQIPFYKNRKSLLFRKSEIDSWIEEGKRKSKSELKDEAARYQNKAGRKQKYE